MNIRIMSPWQWKNQRMKAINEKSQDQSYSYGCIMGYFDLGEYQKINRTVNEIEESDIYDNEAKEYGREIEPHVTILYGLHDNEIDEDEVIQLLQSLKLPEVQLTEISCFNNDEYDVLKWDVESEFLNMYNKIVTLMFPFTSKFPDYHAHCTIAYLKPGSGEKYSQKVNMPIDLQIKNWVYSQANGRKISITADGTVEVLREADVKQELEVQAETQTKS